MSVSNKIFSQYVKKLSQSFKGSVDERIGMKKFTTFKIGGLAQVIAWPKDTEDLENAVNLALEMELPWQILGAGSNLLVGDGGVNEILINLQNGYGQMDVPEPEMEEGKEIIHKIGAGVKISQAVKQYQKNGYCGLEWAAGIPGSIGGAVIMNAGCMGSCMADLVEWVDLYVPNKGVERIEKADLLFKYRKINCLEGSVVLGCGLKIKTEDPKTIRERIVRGLKTRRNSQPLSHPSAGSVFKNPEGDFAGRMIESVGLKAKRVGDAQISDLHANFIVNRGRARSRDVLNLIELAREKVQNQFGVLLELEIEIIGEEL